LAYLIQLIKSAERDTTNWSGGSTSQIAIHPQHAEYGKRNFTWRLSSAKVELAESTFTSLPGIQRVLMVTDGEVTLKHQGHHSICLKPFAQDRFYGDWTTKSFGKVSDFNLMMAHDCKGELSSIALVEKTRIETAVLSSRDCSHFSSAFYCLDGSVRLLVNQENSYELHEGDALLLTGEQQDKAISLEINNFEDKIVHVIRADMLF
jgi:environmental stress-induced protein Ves